VTTAGPPASPAPPQVLLGHHLRQLKFATGMARPVLVLKQYW
jgi:hypothetical protein